MSYSYRTSDMVWGILSESTYRTNTIAAITTIYKLDEPMDSFESPENELKKEIDRRVGGGRNASVVRDMGYELASDGISFYLQTAFFLNKVLGTCITTTFHFKTSATAWTLFDGSTTPALVYVKWSANTHTEDITLWGINSNGQFESATLTTTVDDDPPIKIPSSATDEKWIYIYYFTTTGTAVADTCIICDVTGATTYLSSEKNAAAAELGNTGAGGAGYSDYYRHAIVEANSLGSFTFHREWQNSAAAHAQDIIKDLFGCMVSDYELNAELKAKVSQKPTLTVAKTATGLAQTSPPSSLAVGTYSEVGWDDLKTIYLTYNTAEIQASLPDYTRKLTLGIANKYEVDHGMGDKFPKVPHIGIRDYTMDMTYYARQKTLFDLSLIEYKDYATALAAYIRFQPSQYRMFYFKHTDLAVISHTKMMKKPSENDDILCDVSLEQGDSDTLTIDVIDTLSATASQLSG